MYASKSAGTSVPGPEPEHEEKATRPSKRPRTTAQTKKNNQNTKPVFSGLFDMPIEIFNEIACNLLPPDLISLSRTCKTFRGILMKKSAEKIWTRAERNVPRLPSYPWSNMSKPRYAALVFLKICTSCGEATSNSADPYLLARLAEIYPPHHPSFQVAELLCQTDMIHFKKRDAFERHRGAGPPKYCLRSEFNKTQNAFNLLSQAGCPANFQLWKQEVSDEVKMRRKFGRKLREYFALIEMARTDEIAALRRKRRTDIEGRLGELGWTEQEVKFGFEYPMFMEWQALVELPQVLTDRVWKNLLPKLTPLLEASRARLELIAADERQMKRRIQLHELLWTFKLDNHPLKSLFKVLGIDRSTEQMSPRVARIVDFYPFPHVTTALKWSFFEDVEKDISIEEVKGLFKANQNGVQTQAKLWRKSLESELVGQIFDETSMPKPKAMVKLHGSTAITRHLEPETRVLLRADCVFRHESNSKNIPNQGQFLYYPEFVPTTSTYNGWEVPGNWSSRNYYRHVKAEKVVKALLTSLGMPDVAYLELVAMGERFVCGRCHSHKAMDWNGIVQHYLDELEAWSLVVSVAPRFKTRHRIHISNVHDLDPTADEHEDSPALAGIVTKEEAESLAPHQSGEAFYCMPCKNYSRTCLLRDLEVLEDHLWQVHSVRGPVKGIHFGLASGSRTFLENGGAWRDRWDGYHDRRVKAGAKNKAAKA
ncbi:F-box protein [Ceratobasidium theobromae]|uniref:F-box protein n=1 Tax=Ceratobasidium theobromae TaxID=1582974 RepID=A0A5N5QA25_9AGAM|nr:F-box protein [Ceratobasidium theobromae]